VRRQGGFTLLEVMTAMAILAGSLTYLLLSQTQSVRSSNRSKMLTTATLLARAQMAELEDELFEEGFTDLGVDEAGDFSDQGFPSFRWEWLVENVELPTAEEAGEAAASAGEGGAAEQDAPGLAAAAMGSGSDTADAASSAMAAQFEIFRGMLEATIRRGTFTVFWKERSKEHSFAVQVYFTDPSRLGTAMAGGPPGPAGIAPAGRRGN